MSKRERYTVTAALPYSNGRLHVGHMAGAYVPADIYVRFRRAKGDDVLFVSGSDDNGVAITITAQKEGTTPADVVAKYNASQRRAFAGMGIDFDVYGGTHVPGFVETHERLSQAFFRAIHDKGYFTKRSSKQLFDPVAGKFLPDRYVTGVCHYCGKPNANGDQCEACGKSIDPLLLKDPKSALTGAKPEVRETTHWHLRLADFEAPLEAWLRSRVDWRPTVLNFSLGQIGGGLPERAMTRDLDWGVPVPLDDAEAKGKVLYVWFDAPIGYVSFTAQCLLDRGLPMESYAERWKNPDCKILHFIGEDNIIFHSLIWPAMLMAYNSSQTDDSAKFQLPHQVVANSFLNIKFPGMEEEKISKSRGTAIWIEDYLQEYDPDPLRYYLTAIAPEGARTAYEPDDFIARNDGELVATLGNLVNRTIPFAHKYFAGKIPAAGERAAAEHELLALRETSLAAVAEHLEGFRFKAALEAMMAFAKAVNGYLAVKQPWNQRKTDMPGCGTTINVALQAVQTLMVMMQPFLPFSARKCAAMLWPDDAAANRFSWDQATVELPAGRTLGEPVMLFKKLREEPKS